MPRKPKAKTEPVGAIPADEISWVSYRDASGAEKFVLTSDKNRITYMLYQVNADGSLSRLGEADSPVELEEKFNVDETIATKG